MVKFLYTISSKVSITETMASHSITLVPTANLSNSKTPMGPFQMTVWVVSRAELNAEIESGPMSRPIHASGIADAGTTWRAISCSDHHCVHTMIQEQLFFLKLHACLDNTTRNKNVTNLTASIRSKLISDDLTAWRRSVILNSDDLCAWLMYHWMPMLCTIECLWQGST